MKLYGKFVSILLLSGVLVIAFPDASAQTLSEINFTAQLEAEATLDLMASVPGASWEKAGSEAATVSIFVDGQKHQDAILFAGAKQFTYRLLLGRVSPGEHKLRIELNRQQSAASVSTANVADAKVTLLPSSHPEFQMIAHAPILFARPDTIGKFSDVPLLMYCETLQESGKTILRYTVIFSNEDGGTQTAALMARWGRTTDIEWVVDVVLDAEGRVINSIYQGANHVTKTFQGKREADHPLFLTATVNNNFSDQGDSAMRFALRPISVDLSRHSREWVMDQHPWTYTVMAEEMIREGKITTERTLGARIGDLRNYLYVDAASNQQNGALISFAVKLKNDPRWYTSDFGINSYKIERSGYFRTTIRLPKGTTLNQIERLSARCDLNGNPRSQEEISKATAASCELNSVNKVFLTDEKFQPSGSLHIKTSTTQIRFGEAVDFPIDPRNRK
ncbi:MAG: hypothetical protein JNK38_16335 [Acidobacteria bacterium]|nr:hypothetical protein [Acidobacteriota bacterium]